MDKNFTNKGFGVSMPVGFPLIPHQRKRYPGLLMWRVIEVNKRGGTIVHGRRLLGF